MKTPLFVSWLLALAICGIVDAAAVRAQQAAEQSPTSPRTLQGYIKKLGDADQRERLLAAHAIAGLGAEAAPAVPELIHMLETSSENKEKIAAAMALTRIGPAAKAAIPALRRMAASPDGNVSKVANLAITAIEPPASTRIWGYLTSTYGMATTIALGAGLLAFFVLARFGAGRADEKELSKKPEPERVEVKPAATPASKPAVAAATVKAGVAAKPPPRTIKPRARVSRPLLSHAGYVQEEEGPETVKRDLHRAQETLKHISVTQKELAGYLDRPEVKKDPERMRQLRKDIDEHSIEHYRAEVRIKALEVKMLEIMLGSSKTTDGELRERSEATIRQKWDALRTYCEAPVKIVWQSGKWTNVANGPKRKIVDLRDHLRDFDISFPNNLVGLPDEPSIPPSTPSSGEEPIEVDAEETTLSPEAAEHFEEVATAPDEVAPEPELVDEPSGPEEIALLQADDQLDPDEIARIIAEAEAASMPDAELLESDDVPAETAQPEGDGAQPKSS